MLGHSDAAWWRQLLHPGGEPDDVPLRGVVHAQVVADPPHDDLAGVQAHPHRELEPALAPHVFGERAELARQIQGGRTGALGVVLVGDRGAEERHDAVAGVLVDGPLVSVNAARKDPEQAIEQAMPFLGIDALRELHRAHDVGEEDGDQLALAPERALGRKNLLDEMPRRVGARLAGDGRRREVRATIVAEPRAGGVLVSAEWAVTGPLPILAHPRVSRAGPTSCSRAGCAHAGRVDGVSARGSTSSPHRAVGEVVAFVRGAAGGSVTVRGVSELQAIEPDPQVGLVSLPGIEALLAARQRHR